MKRTFLYTASLSIAACLLATGALAQSKLDEKSAQALLQKSGCIACHTVDKKIIGPAYKDVAAKYRTVKGADKTLIAKVREGGKGAWGEIPMSPNPTVPEADVRALVQWILTLK